MQRRNFTLACLLMSLLAVRPASAQTLDAADVAEWSTQEVSSNFALGGMYFDVFNTTGNGVGWRQGFTQLGMFVPLQLGDDWLVASNNRLTITDGKQLGGNVGGLLRYYAPGQDRLYGINAYYDTDESLNGFRYHQATLGFESLGKFFDFRLNGYLPTTQKQNYVRATGLENTPYFAGHRINALGYAEFEENQGGGDFEVGVPVLPRAPWLRGYAGAYFYDGTHEDPVGVRGRLEAWISDDLNVGVTVSDDKTHGTNLNTNVTFRFSGFKPTRYFPYWTTRERMTMPVQRNWRIATDTYNEAVAVAFRNPLNDQPYFVTWVDPANTRAGDGTFENPFSTMPSSSAAADLILVRDGTNGVAPTTNQPTSLALFDNQRLLGTGQAHRFDGYARNGAFTTGGNYLLPGFVDSGVYPTLTGIGNGNVITLANNNEVAAFNINNAQGTAIANTSTGSNGFNIHDVNLNGNGAGVRLTNASGNGTIRNVTANGNANGGVVLDTGASPLSLAMSNVVANGSTNGPGIGLIADHSDLFVAGGGWTANNNQQNVWLSANGRTLAADLFNVMTSNASQANMLLDSSNGGLLSANINGGAARDGLSSGIITSTTGANSRLVANLTNVNAQGNNTYGLAVSATNGSIQNVRVIDSNFSDSGLDAFNVFGAGGSNVTLFVDPTPATSAGRDGFAFNMSGNSFLNATLEDVDLTGAGRNGIAGLVDDSHVLLNLRNVNANSAGADGLSIAASNTSTVQIAADTLNVGRAGQTVPGSDAIALRATSGSGIWSALNNVTGQNVFTRSAANGLVATADGAGSVNSLTLTNGNFSDMGRTAITGIASNGAYVSLGLTDVVATGSLENGAAVQAVGANTFAGLNLNRVNLNSSGRSVGSAGQNNGLTGLAQAGGSLGLNLTDVNLTGAGEHAITLGALNGNVAGVWNNVDARNAGVLGTVAANSVFLQGADASRMVIGANQLLTGSTDVARGPTVNGLQYAVTTGSLLDLNATNSVFNNNLQSGVTGSAVFGSVASTRFTNSQINNNGTNGVRLQGNNSSVVAGFTQTSVSDNVGAGVRADLSGAVNSQLDFESAVVTNNGSDGVAVSGTAGANVVVTANLSQFSDNAGRGMMLSADGAGTVVNADSLRDSEFDDNAAEGLFLNGLNSGVIRANVQRGTIRNNGSHGIGGQLMSGATGSLVVHGTTISNNAGAGISIPGGVGTGFGLTVNNAIIQDNAGAGIDVDLGSSGQPLTIVGNQILSNGGAGIRVTANGGAPVIAITDNSVISNGTNGIEVSLAGSANSQVFIDRNEVLGAGRAASFNQFGLNFTAYSETAIDDSGFFTTSDRDPIDISGGVGPLHLVLMTNDGFRVYDKATGAQVAFLTLDSFWSNAGAQLSATPSTTSKTKDAKIIYDTTSGRWFAVATDFADNDNNLGDSVYVAVSNTSNPLDGWKSVQFAGDGLAIRSNTFINVGLDADGVYITTNETTSQFTGTGTSTSIYSIPKADLLGATPSIARLTRFENLTANGFSVQPVLDLGPSDGRSPLLGTTASNAGTSLTRTDLTNTGGPVATISTPANITVPGYSPPNIGTLPDPNIGDALGQFISLGDGRLASQVVEVNGEIWAVQGIAGTGANSVIRWYRIDEATNNVIETGDIAVSGLNLQQPSIAVSEQGAVLIGYTGSSSVNPNSAFAVVGGLVNGTTRFSAPIVVAAGNATFSPLGAGFLEDWGNNSSLVQDPSDPNRFWTFQEFAFTNAATLPGATTVTDRYSVQIASIDTNAPVTGLSTGAGILVNVSESARISAGSISDNIVSDFGTNGIQVQVADNGRIDGLPIHNNTVTGNGNDGLIVDTFDSTPTLPGPAVGTISVVGGTYSNNSGRGVNLRFNNTVGATRVDVNGLTVADNGGRGISVQGNQAAFGPVSLSGNTVTTNGATVGAPNGTGIFFQAFNTSALSIGNLLVDGNTITGNAGSGIDLLLTNTSGNGVVSVAGNTIGGAAAGAGNQGFGASLRATNAELDQLLFTNNTIQGNTGGDGIRAEMTGGSLNVERIAGNIIVGNTGYGINSVLTGVAGNGAYSALFNDVRSNTGRGALGSGISLVATNTALSEVAIAQNVAVLNNFGDGVRVFATNSPIGGLYVDSNANISNNSLNGINIGLTDSDTGALIINNNQVIDLPTPPPPGGTFNISLNLTGMTPAQEAVFRQAAQRWEQIITADIPDVGLIDDLLIAGELTAIDGAGGILGQAGPTGLRNGSNLPFSGIMQFDTADVAALEAAGQFDEVILHEMAHVLGFGTIWQLNGLLQGAGTNNPLFTGVQATAEHNVRFAQTLAGVPVENTGGPGTRDGHWRETIYGAELLTGFLDAGVPNPISRVSIASFGDLGYTVDLNVADPFLMSSGDSLNGYIEPGEVVRNSNFTFANANATSDLARIATNGANGVNIGLTRSDVGALRITNNTVANNGQHGVELTVVDSVLPSTLNSPVIVSGNAILDQVNGDGFRLVNPDTNLTPIGISFANNTIANNGTTTAGAGINIQLADQALTSEFVNNTINANGLQGINLQLQAQNLGHTVNVLGNRSISGNGTIAGAGNGAGVNISVATGSTLNSRFNGNLAISSNDGPGVNIDLAPTANLNLSDFSGNTVNNNAGMGLRVRAQGGQSLALPNPSVILNIGTASPGQINTISGNQDAGIGLNLTDNRVASIVIDQTIIGNTTNGTDPNFNGEGFRLTLTDTAQAPNLIIRNSNFIGNASDGIGIDIGGTSQLVNPLFENVVSRSNTGDGLRINRDGTAVLDNARILGGRYEGNADDGIDLTAGFALAGGVPLVDEYLISGSIVSNNNDDGISLIARGDAQLNTQILGTRIASNGDNGVFVDTVTTSAGDAALVTLAMFENTIESNGRLTNALGAGIAIDGFHQAQIGDASRGNLIVNNGGSGIRFENFVVANGGLDGASGTAILQNNYIAGNNQGGLLGGDAQADGAGIRIGVSTNVTGIGNTIAGNAGDGIEIENVNGGIGTYNFTNNLITLNARDGVEFEVGTIFNSASLTLDSNRITDNTSRGVDVLVKSGADATVNINDNTVAGQSQVLRNGLEGVYVVLTAAGAQSRNAASSDALLATGAVNGGASTPFLNFNMNRTIVRDNGSPQSIHDTDGSINTFDGGTDVVGASGLVMRVGTTLGGQGFTTPGSFASLGSGGVIANVTNNVFGGNFGSDVTFHSFASTADPAQVGGLGDWTNQNDGNPANDIFTIPNGYQADPLARLDLTFTGNSGEEALVTRVGAFYDNADALKSRTNNLGAGGPDGPYSTTARLRNAQRFAARDVDSAIFGRQGLPIPPTVNVIDTVAPIFPLDSDSYLFPGMGQSTFRISASSVAAGANNFTTFDNFAVDDVLFDDFFFDVGAGAAIRPSSIFGNSTLYDVMGYSWSLLP